MNSYGILFSPKNNFNLFLSLKLKQLSIDDICETNHFLNYDNFKKFIFDHYQLNHVETHNYIKYVKIRRQILLTAKKDSFITFALPETQIGFLNPMNDWTYQQFILEINSIIKIMSNNHLFPNINIQKYMYKINVLFRLIEEKKLAHLNTIENIRSLFELKGDDVKFKFRIMICINNINYRYCLFIKYSRKLIYLINKLIELETSNGIDHKLIELNNMERTFLGRKSEYISNKIILDYINSRNMEIQPGVGVVGVRVEGFSKYFYETNIDFLKLFKIEINQGNNIKGEADGMIISFDGNNYIIDRIIGVKSSIKATFEDISKFICLQKYINKLPIDIKIKYKKYIFTFESFINMIDKDLTDWVTYICINNLHQDVIEKSHLYFSNVLKIVDDKFIKDFYIDNNEQSIIEKYQLIEDNRQLIDNLYNEWSKNIKFGTSECNIFIIKK